MRSCHRRKSCGICVQKQFGTGYGILNSMSGCNLIFVLIGNCKPAKFMIVLCSEQILHLTIVFDIRFNFQRYCDVTVDPMPVKHSWGIRVNEWHGSNQNNYITSPNHSARKPFSYFTWLTIHSLIWRHHARSVSPSTFLQPSYTCYSLQAM